MTQAKVAPRAEPQQRRSTIAAPLCHVCGKPVFDKMDSTCRVCARPVHIAWRQDAPESACSRVVSPPGCCGIAFVCSPCAETQGFGPAQ
jgi:hypothetical protein